MPVFDSAESLYEVMQDVFLLVSAEPETLAPFLQTNLVIRIRFDGPTAEVLIDGRQPPLEVFYGERPGDADLDVEMAADLLHELWLDRESTSGAFFSGRIRARGNLLKLMKLVDLFRECERVYPQVARSHQLP